MAYLLSRIGTLQANGMRRKKETRQDKTSLAKRQVATRGDYCSVASTFRCGFGTHICVGVLLLHVRMQKVRHSKKARFTLHSSGMAIYAKCKHRKRLGWCADHVVQLICHILPVDLSDTTQSVIGSLMYSGPSFDITSHILPLFASAPPSA